MGNNVSFVFFIVVGRRTWPMCVLLAFNWEKITFGRRRSTDIFPSLFLSLWGDAMWCKKKEAMVEAAADNQSGHKVDSLSVSLGVFEMAETCERQSFFSFFCSWEAMGFFSILSFYFLKKGKCVPLPNWIPSSSDSISTRLQKSVSFNDICALYVLYCRYKYKYNTAVFGAVDRIKAKHECCRLC